MLRGLAQYRVLGSLGRGAQGEALLALDTRLQRKVCIKLYHLDGGLAVRRGAVAEAWHLTRVEGVRTAGIHDVVAHGRRLALVTRYVRGCDLAALLATPPRLPPANVVAIASDIAAGLAELRRSRLSHGDLTAANVRIDRRGRAVLVDFGMAALAGEAVPGFSRESLSPEQLRGERMGLQSDFFALGLLLYRMLFGAHPFYRDGALDPCMLRQGLRAIPELPEWEASAALPMRALLQDLLASSPDRRPASTFALRERLRELRGLLPAPLSLETRVRALAARGDATGPPARLPARLVHLPLAQRVAALLRSYWRGGTQGARILLAGACFTALTLGSLLLLQPGPCIAVSPPSLGVGSAALAVLPDPASLHARLTSVLKRSAARAIVLGAGAHSNSRPSLTARGLRDTCIAQRRLDLDLHCRNGRCLLETRGRRDDRIRVEQLWLPQDANDRRLQGALEQLVRGQLAFLL